MKPAVPDPPQVHRQLWQGFEGQVGWDVGANCGQTVPEMLNRFEKVVAFEPADECWPYLQDFDEPNFFWLPIGLSDKDEKVDLIALPDKIDTGQLVTAGTIGMEWDPTDPAAEVRTVICRTIDSLVSEENALIGEPDFLKIDVEGHELKVLYGARKLLAIKRPNILLEFHAPELHRACVDLLNGYGYDCVTIRHPHYYPGSPLWFQHGWVRATQ